VARALGEELPNLGRALGDQPVIAKALDQVGPVALAQGQPAAARPHFEASLTSIPDYEGEECVPCSGPRGLRRYL
jgi:hypothetical protein